MFIIHKYKLQKFSVEKADLKLVIFYLHLKSIKRI